MPLDKTEIRTKYYDILESGYSDIDELDQEERDGMVEAARGYYQYLSSRGVKYGAAALEVINDQGQFGKFANINLKAQSIFEGIDPGSYNVVRDNIIISLAFKDVQMRLAQDEVSRKEELAAISKYHREIFGKFSTPYAWGGLLMEEVVGVGSWMGLYESGGGFIEGFAEILKARHGQAEGQYSIERLLQGAHHSMKVLSTGLETEFSPVFTCASKEMAAKIFGVDAARVEEIDSQTPEGAMLESKAFKIKPSPKFQRASEDDGVQERPEEVIDTKELVARGFDAKLGVNSHIYGLLGDERKLKELQEAAMSEARKSFGEFEEEFPELGGKIKAAAAKSASMAKELHNIAIGGMSQRDMQRQREEAKSFVDDLCLRTESIFSSQQGQRQREEAEKHAKDMSAMMASMWTSTDAQDLMAALGMASVISNVWGNFGETSSDN